MLIVLRQFYLNWGVDGLLLVIDRVSVGDLDVEESSVEPSGYLDSAPDLRNSFYGVDRNWWSFVVENLDVGGSKVYAYVSGADLVYRALLHEAGELEFLGVRDVVKHSARRVCEGFQN